MGYVIDHPLRRLLQPPEPLLRSYVQSGQTAADLGCGMGYYTLALARLVGLAGRVYAVDLQPQMLKALRRRARRRGLLERIELVQCRADRLGLTAPVDFALAANVIHETPDPGAFLRQVREILKPEARFLALEPRGHVPQADFAATLQRAREAGLILQSQSEFRGGRAALLTAG